VASWGASDSAPTAEDRLGLEAAVRAAELAVADLTGLPTPPELTRVEVTGRGRWVEVSLRDLRDLLEPIAARLSAALREGTVGPAAPTEGPGELVEALMQRMTPLLMGAQLGMVLGDLGQRALGAYDLAVPRPTGTLLFVAPNVVRFEKDWSLPAVEFREWLAIHEVTHRLAFAGSWVREHFLRLVRDLVEHAEIDLGGIEGRLEAMDLSNPEALTEVMDSMGNLFGQASTPEQRLRADRVRAFLAIAEAYGDHVTEALARRLLPSSSRIGEALARHRDGRHADRALERLLGLRMEPELYRRGRELCDRVVHATDQATLATMWQRPDGLPSMPELEEPALWLARMA
jgi:putative hydrolase